MNDAQGSLLHDHCRRVRKTVLSGLTNGTFSITTTTAYLYDGNGNVMALVDAADRSILASYEYDPSGSTLRATGAKAAAKPFRFSTKYTDNETGLVYYGYRYYASQPGGWPNRELIGEIGSVGLYVFVMNSRSSFGDALGLALSLMDAIAGEASLMAQERTQEHARRFGESVEYCGLICGNKNTIKATEPHFSGYYKARDPFFAVRDPPKGNMGRL